MFSKNIRARLSLLVLLVVMVASVSALAGSAVIGSVAGSMNATIGGQALMPNTTVFSGDSLQVKDGAAVVAVGAGSRLVFGRETVVSFLRDEREVTVLLGQGNVSLYHPSDQVGLRVKVGEISVMPAAGYKTLGEVAMVNGAVVITAKEGLLRVEGAGPAVEVAKGKTITVQPKTARSPQGGAGSGTATVSGTTMLQVASIATGATATALSATAVVRSGDAGSAAESATNTAQDAATAASNAEAAAEAATAAAEAAQETANDVGCALDGVLVANGGVSVYDPDNEKCGP
ncbi:MAG: hypothetical protein HYS33_02980 [Acidobacteria bacterium]|nr:hypothetical protein [Acidobacteriota bacterium]